MVTSSDQVKPAPRRKRRFEAGKRLSLDQTLKALIEDGWLSELDARHIRHAATASTRVSLHPLVAIANQKVARASHPDQTISLTSLTRWLAEQAGLPYYEIDPMNVDVDTVTQVVSQAYAGQYRILPLEVTTSRLLIATSEPFDLSWVSDLAHILRREVRVVVASPLDVNRFQLEFYGVSQSVRLAEDAKLRSDSERILNFEQLLQLGDAGKLSADDQHVVYIVDWLLQFAFEQRASDIHLEPRRERSNVRFRIDGNLHTVYQIPTAVMGAVTSRIKILGRMDVAEKRRPQDGRIRQYRA